MHSQMHARHVPERHGLTIWLGTAAAGVAGGHQRVATAEDDTAFLRCDVQAALSLQR
jgi:uncharacterized protein (UPF0254 family)